MSTKKMLYDAAQCKRLERIISGTTNRYGGVTRGASWAAGRERRMKPEDPFRSARKTVPFAGHIAMAASVC